MAEKKDPFSKALNLSLGKFVLFSLLTCGLYYVYVQAMLNMVAIKYGDLKTTRKAINAYSFAMTFWLLGLWLIGAGFVTDTFEVIIGGAALFFLGCLGHIRWAFIFRRVISLYHEKEYKLAYSPNRFLLFFTHALFLVFAINRTDKRVEKHNKK